jgi:hypothetical protein
LKWIEQNSLKHTTLTHARLEALSTNHNARSHKLGLAQMVRFLVVEQVHPCSNIRFDVDAAYLRLIILSVIVDIPVDSDALFDRLLESLRLSRLSFSEVLI